jgi:hypothetical protein
MKRILLLLLLFATGAGAQTRVKFEAPGALPKGWQCGVTGNGTAKWVVVREDSAVSSPLVLKQSGEATFCWAAKMDVKIADGFAEVRFKPVGGQSRCASFLARALVGGDRKSGGGGAGGGGGAVNRARKAAPIQR